MINTSNIKSAQLTEVICIELTKGDGTTKSPYTRVFQYWTKAGELIGEIRV